MILLLLMFGLLGAGWIVYGQVTRFLFIPLDDPGYVYENAVVRHGLTWPGVRWAFQSTEQGNWHPLTWLSLMLDAQIYGLNPGGFHFTNFLLHELASLLLLGWLVTATRRLWPSAAVALLFCIHPAHVESVAWITERKDVLSTVFFFLLLLAYTRYAQTGRRFYYAGTLAALILGLLAKPMLVTLPPLLLLLDAWPLGRWRRARDLPQLLLEKLPLAAVAGASCVITFVAQRGAGATVPLGQIPLSWRLAGAVTAYAAYVGKLCWPSNLGVFYPYWTVLPLARTCAYALGIILAVGGAVRCYRARPYVLIGTLWFFGMLVPVIGLVQVGSQGMADRYTYQPAVGLFIVLCWGLADLGQALPRPGRWGLAAGAVAGLGGCLVLAHQQAGCWRDGPTLLRHTIAVTRPDADAFTMLGGLYERMDCLPEAEAAYRQGFKLQPNRAELVWKLGNVSFAQNHWAQAAQWLSQLATRGRSRDPEVFGTLGLACIELNRPGEAQAAFRRSLALRPNDARMHGNLARTLLAGGNLREANEEYARAISLDPDLVPALSQLAWLESFGGRVSNPPQVEQALALAQRAVVLTHGEDPASLDALAAAQAATGDWAQAAHTAHAALTKTILQPAREDGSAALHLEREKAYQEARWPVH